MFPATFRSTVNPLGQDYATLVSQSRLLYNFCIGYELTQDDEYLHAVEKGIRFLLGNFRDNEYGGRFSTCRRDGQVLDFLRDTYGPKLVRETDHRLPEVYNLDW